MITAYKIESGQLTPSDTDAAHVLVCCQPTDAEKTSLCCLFALDPFDLEAVNDPDEVPRAENTQDGAFIIWKRPDNVSQGDAIQFEVSSLGIAIRQNRIAFIVPRGDVALSGREFKRVGSVWDCALNVILHSVHHYPRAAASQIGVKVMEV
jgi:hypothetical protein